MDKLNERAIRILAAALLESNLTIQDLRKVADELKYGPLSSDLGMFLNSVIGSLSLGPYSKTSSLDRSRNSEVIDAVLRKKISKDQAFAWIRQTFDGSIKPPLNPKASTRALISAFLDRATDQQKLEFMQMVERHNSNDPFLKGISSR